MTLSRFAGNITITGIDEFTDILEVKKLLEFAKCEVGILYTETPEGRNRYPSRSWIEKTVVELSRCSIALHICGGKARQALVNKSIKSITDGVKRIQVNGKLTIDEVERICDLYPFHYIITQHNENNKDLLLVSRHNHSVLVDASGGRGVSPLSWNQPDANDKSKFVGYAGGLGPDNLAEQIIALRPIVGPSWWVDMEGKLRDKNDKFDIGLAKQVVGIFLNENIK